MLGSVALAAPPAQASFHQARVSEVMLAAGGGDASVQFVGLLDLGGPEEVFPAEFAPYKLVVYSPAGVELGEQTLSAAGLRSAAAFGSRYLISTAGADSLLGTIGDERLRVALPPGGGQACYQANFARPALSCLTWGAIAMPVPTNTQGFGSVNGPVAPGGQSDQLRADGSIVAARPFAGVRPTVRIAKVDRRGRARIGLRCPASTAGSCQGRLTLIPARGGARLGAAGFAIAAAGTSAVQVRLSGAALRQLRRRGRLAARALSVGHDAAGTSETTTSALTLVRGR
jgi:hypothetical protein